MRGQEVSITRAMLISRKETPDAIRNLRNVNAIKRTEALVTLLRRVTKSML